MQDWNVVVTINGGSFRQAVRFLGRFGPLRRTEFFNVLVMKVADCAAMLETLRDLLIDDPRALTFLSRLVPVTVTFAFQSPEEFQNRAREAVLGWVSQLAGKSFHVRMYRRGFRRKLCSPDEERLLDAALLEALEKAGTPGRITFEDPDAVIAIQTVGQRAGLSFWTRQELQRYPFIRLS